MRTLRSATAIVLIMTTTACVIVKRRVDVNDVDYRKPILLTNPVKAHLKDGSTVVYPVGVTVTATELQGNGTRYPFAGSSAMQTGAVPLDQVVGMESYRESKQGQFGVSLLATAAGAVGTLFLLKAIFGSCPTVYSADGEIQEAELFSSSIAPLFEGRDIDLLKTQPDNAGMLSLDIRNEALETHYLNHLQLIEVAHARDEIVLPDALGESVALRAPHAVASARNRKGQDVSRELASADTLFYASDPVAIQGASAADMDDWIDVTVPVQPGATTAGLAFRLRNSLLNTVLMYDVMLGPSGAGALNWMSGSLSNISSAVEMGRWHQRRAGLHVSVWQDGRYREVARVPDAGPVAWHDVAAVVPVPAGETNLRVRLSFLVDHWRIDRLAVSTSVRQAEAREIPLSAVRGSKGTLENEALSNMSAPDDRYLQTNPGHRFFAEFQTGLPQAGRARTFLLSSQGYYTEWIRGSWIKNATTTAPFTPGDAAVLEALHKWGGAREAFENRFYSTRVPVK
jgi:hypothetical protein